MTALFLVLLLLLAYGVLCVLAPAKHLALNAWLNRRGRKQWHEERAYTTPYLRLQRRWNQQTPGNLWRLRITGIAFIGMSLWGMGNTGEYIAKASGDRSHGGFERDDDVAPINRLSRLAWVVSD